MAIQIPEYGKTLTIRTERDLTGVQSLRWKVKKPNGQEVFWTPVTIFTDPTATPPIDSKNGITKYVLAAGDVSIPGTWTAQCEATFSGVKQLVGKSVPFPAAAPYERVIGA